MAACSPIPIGSSSPDTLHAPSITPPGHQSKSSVAESSSPGLPSPSTFVKPFKRNPPSESGAHSLTGIRTEGLAPVANLLRTNQFERRRDDSRPDGQSLRKGDENDGEESNTSIAQLAGPKKRQETMPRARDGGVTAQIPPSDLDCQKSTSCRGDKKQVIDPNILVTKAATSNVEVFANSSRKPDVSVSENDHWSEDGHSSALPKKASNRCNNMTVSSKTSSVDGLAKQSRKRPAKQPTGAAPRKMPRKKFTKSASIILNSDEPDPVLEGGPQPTTIVSAEQPFDSGTGNMGMGASLETAPGPILATHITATADALAEDSPHFAQSASARVPPLGVSILADAVGSVKSDALSAPEQNISRKVQPSVPEQEPSGASASDVAGTERERRETSALVEYTASHDPIQSLSALVSGFAYEEQNYPTVSCNRTVTGEALTKRRRVEFADASIVGPPLREEPEKSFSVQKKRTKAAKKKPQTITELATRAYRAQTEDAIAQENASNFCVPQRQPHDTSLPARALGNSSVKHKPARKPRAKKADAASVASKTKKPKKSKLDGADYLAKLYPPEAARAEEKRQGFLFGSSSQLAVEESPTSIRDMQLALQESEGMPASQTGVDLRRKSRVRVPTAPGGTGLSIGQTNRDLWCVAARNRDGDVLKLDMGPVHSKHSIQPRSFARPLEDPLVESSNFPSQLDMLREDTAEEVSGDRPDRSTDHALRTFAANTGTVGKHEVVDLCQSSPTSRTPRPAAHGIVCRNETMAGVPEAKAAHLSSDDSWMLLESDDSPLHEVAVPPPQQAALPNPQAQTLAPAPTRSTTSPVRRRTVLQTLDANVNVLTNTVPRTDFSPERRQCYATAALPTKASRPRGRPRKGAEATPSNPASRASHGKSPDKVSVSPKTLRPLQATATTDAVSLASPATSFTKWANIDEISDSDVPLTPSPPRRRATSPPVPQLNFPATASPSLKAKAPAVVAARVKNADAEWPAIRAKLFPQITTAVKSTPPSTDMARPTWHEKMLLYDPIVLEDLTAWLNEYGLRIEVCRVKAKKKTRGRKKKGADEEREEYERVEEELLPWMVQKWCEERSVCCLWKEGTNGNRRNRYS